MLGNLSPSILLLFFLLPFFLPPFSLSLAASIQPITRTVLRVRLKITPEFEWNDKLVGGSSDPWWIWVEDPVTNYMYHSEYFLLQKKQVWVGSVDMWMT